MNILYNNKTYIPYYCKKEDEFESIVVKLSNFIFGENTIYIDIKRKILSKSFNIIPDGYLLDMTELDEPKLYIIENEIISHHPYKHIGNQMLRFAINYDDSQLAIRKLLMQQILSNPILKEKLNIAYKKSSSRNIDAYLDRAVYSSFKALVVIDEAKPELYKVLEKINADISVLQLQSFICDKEFIYQYDTLYEEDKLAIDIKTDVNNGSVSRKERLAKCDTIIVPAHEEGFQEEFIDNNQWFAIRISAAMKSRIKYIAGYQVAPISAITHIAEISEIKPYKDTGKYIVIFKSNAEKIKNIKIKDSKKSPQGCVYVQRDKLLASTYLEDAL